MLNSLMNDISPEGKMALVTGGSKGIGKALADRLAQAGAKVVITARNPPGEGSGDHPFIAADLTRPESKAVLVGEVEEKFGGADILIDNAGG